MALLVANGYGRAETVLWSDNFETNAASRWTNNGVWHIGSPTAGPAVNANGFRTYSGTNCASTQNYPYSQDARLVCTNYNGTNWLVIPAANLSPRLRFWQWFNYQVAYGVSNALGYVEINTGTNNWQKISSTYEGVTSGGVWSRPSLDLSPYAGKNVQIAFHFTCGCCTGNNLGWYVDDVAVVTNASVLNNPESFETGQKTNDWAVDFGTWEIGKPTSGPNAARTGTNCAATILAGNYANNADSRLISPPFAIPASNSPALHFWHWYSFNNALGFVEINNGITNATSSTNITITTNIASSLNTNIYQLFGAADAGYSNAFYWNKTIGGWTNATKALGNVFDATYRVYYFEAGNAPLAYVGQANNVDYRSYTIPSPRTAAATNYLAWQGMTWNSVIYGNDNPVGYFGTNYSYTYTTNTTIAFSQSSWTQISPTYINATSGGNWTNVTLDLSHFAGQTVRAAFHFTSGGTGTAAGWYVDDVAVVANPVLTVPATQTIYAGRSLNVTNYATLLPTNGTPLFSLVSPPITFTNLNLNSTNGILTWTNTASAVPSTNKITITVSDNNSPPLGATNSFTVIIKLPNPPQLTRLLAAANGFQFTLNTVSNTTWRIDASTNLSTWLPIFTNLAGTDGTLQFTDLLATNFPNRFYRAVFP